jgi:hypothetical protein
MNVFSGDSKRELADPLGRRGPHFGNNPTKPSGTQWIERVIRIRGTGMWLELLAELLAQGNHLVV